MVLYTSMVDLQYLYGCKRWARTRTHYRMHYVYYVLIHLSFPILCIFFPGIFTENSHSNIIHGYWIVMTIWSSATQL